MRNILIIATIFFLSSCSPTNFNKQVLIIPKSYRGEIWLFYDQKHNRGNFKKEGNKIIFYVPEDGIIYSKYKPEGTLDQEQYNDNNEKVFITEYLDKENKIYLDGGSCGTLELPDKKKLNYSRFYTGDKTSLDNIFIKTNDYEYIVKKYIESMKR